MATNDPVQSQGPTPYLTLSGHDMAESDRMPGYIDWAQKCWITFQEFGMNWEKYPVDSAFNWAMITSTRPIDIVTIFILALAFTVLRHSLTKHVFVPFSRWTQLTPSNAAKFPESAWKTFVYLFLWLYSLYCVILSGRNVFFQKPCNVWIKYIQFDETYLAQQLPRDIYWMYMAQMGFYLHSVYATLCMDTWRKDSIMMIIHHSLTLFMLAFSFAVKYHEIGALVLFLHDISDVLLEGTKVNVYMKYRGGKRYQIHEFFSTIGLILFTINWFWFRLYWFPLKVLHATNWCAYLHQYGRDPKMYLVLNIMLFMLQAMHIYWFYFILLLIYKIVTGQMREVEDIREEEEIEQARLKKEKEDREKNNNVNGDSSHSPSQDVKKTK